MNDKKAFFGYIKNKKSLWIAAAALVIGVLMMVFGENGHGADGSSVYSEDISSLEARVKTLCERVGGVGNAAVMITLDTTGEQVYARNSRTFGAGDNAESHTEYVTASGGLVPTESRLSRIRGIAVVCTGGNDPNVRFTLTELLCSLFDIPSSSVYIAYGK